MKTALVCGASGQDGAYLARHLLGLGYRVVGTSRDAQAATFANLHVLGIADRVELRSMVLTDFRSVLQTLTKVRPDEIYNLAGQSSVGLSFEQPVETFESIAIGVINLLEVMRSLESSARLYNASSSECFGDTAGGPANEDTPFHPRSPYATAKASAHWAVANYREAYGLFVCNGILFNHESPLRPMRFVTQKIVSAACEIAMAGGGSLHLGDLSVWRDWGWAPEYVEAMHKMLQLDAPQDFVIATGESHSLQDFCEAAFAELGLRAADYVHRSPTLLRPADIPYGRADARRAREVLGWQARYKMRDVVREMVQARMSALGAC
jgi:GDPmannose 4,6-dehydratase